MVADLVEELVDMTKLDLSTFSLNLLKYDLKSEMS